MQRPDDGPPVRHVRGVVRLQYGPVVIVCPTVRWVVVVHGVASFARLPVPLVPANARKNVARDSPALIANVWSSGRPISRSVSARTTGSSSASRGAAFSCSAARRRHPKAPSGDEHVGDQLGSGRRNLARTRQAPHTSTCTDLGAQPQPDGRSRGLGCSSGWGGVKRRSGCDSRAWSAVGCLAADHGHLRISVRGWFLGVVRHRRRHRRVPTVGRRRASSSGRDPEPASP